MSTIDNMILRIRRGDSPLARILSDIYRWIEVQRVPEIPATRMLYGALYRIHDAYEAVREQVAGKLIYEPMVRARFSVGDRVIVSSLPYVRGHARVTVGDDCRLGHFAVTSGRFVDDPELVIGNGVSISSGVGFVVNKRIVIGDRVGIAGRSWISDSDGHPAELSRRLAGEQITEGDVEPLIIEPDVWIGHSVHLLKGANIGRGAVVAAGSVVTRPVPAGALAMGVPARIVTRPW